jgi:hypothetical protein
MPMTDQPTGLPVLSRGKHQTAGEGGCFMEYASVLAGEPWSDEPWSDEPACTHPVLAAIARTVNDATTDPGRGGLLPLVPAVIGTDSADPRIAPTLVALCAGAASGHGRQDRYLTRTLAAAGAGLAGPRAAGWPLASELSSRRRPAAWLHPSDHRHRRSAQRAASLAVAALAPHPTTDRPLRELLEQCIASTRGLLGAAGGVPRPVAASRSC